MSEVLHPRFYSDDEEEGEQQGAVGGVQLRQLQGQEEDRALPGGNEAPFMADLQQVGCGAACCLLFVSVWERRRAGHGANGSETGLQQVGCGVVWCGVLPSVPATCTPLHPLPPHPPPSPTTHPLLSPASLEVPRSAATLTPSYAESLCLLPVCCCRRSVWLCHTAPACPPPLPGPSSLLPFPLVPVGAVAAC